jgi:hypothetical protein
MDTRHSTAAAPLLHTPSQEFRVWLNKGLDGNLKPWHRVPRVAAYVMQLVERENSTTALRERCENEFHAFLTCDVNLFIADLLQAIGSPPQSVSTALRQASTTSSTTIPATPSQSPTVIATEAPPQATTNHSTATISTTASPTMQTGLNCSPMTSTLLRTASRR